MEKSYDIEEKAGTVTQIIHWLNDICGAEHDQITGTDWKTFNTHLKDGVMLCVLINKLLEADGKSLVPIQKGAKSPFFAVDNIKNFNKGCIDYGMAEELTFQTGDLLDLKKDKFINVLHCLHNLGLIANSKRNQLRYSGEMSNTTEMDYFA
ncbi:rac guanine nucleotide exchange factor B-like isoform X2 [Mercenaria mercenaria]|uniref:rac guanine nucleotide exchange factor B-like isoform X2 n=1 Tax=Mercenaria mercenaria TaxID=6596 RepID=UPI00234E5C2A|nr:rac guanine nucleotide exchange factor B-like isoform X2 [Mercenaria mercenaria]